MSNPSGTIAGAIFDALERNERIYPTIVHISRFIPANMKRSLLKRINPTVALGCLAVIIDPYSHAADPRVLLGWHVAYERDKTPWGLLGGSLKPKDAEKSDPADTVKREIREEIGLELTFRSFWGQSCELSQK